MFHFFFLHFDTLLAGTVKNGRKISIFQTTYNDAQKEIFFNTEKKCTCGLDILKKDIGISTTASVSSQR